VERTRAVQVVLGEGEPGVLRLILEAQGFHVVGHARDDEELRTIVGLTRPTVIVLDAGISALALVDTQIRSDYVPIVVVWPKDTYTPSAEEHVEPSAAFLDLGNAVRRVVERYAEPITVPEADDEMLDIEEPPLGAVGRRFGGKARHALVLAAAWTIALTALAAIGLAVPSAFRALEPAGSIHPLLDRAEPALTADREGPGGGGQTDLDPEPSCARGDQVGTGPHPDRGQGRGCALGLEKHGAPGTRSNGHGHGRPDDPGRGSGHRGSSSGGPSKEPPKKEPGMQDGEADPSGDGDSGDGKDHPGEDTHGGSRGGNAGGSDGDQAGSPGRGKGSDKD
jgi:hypothetical protein